jgi:hypothetical protein
MLPGPQHGEQVVGVLLQEEALQKADQEILQRGVAELGVELLQ